MRRVVGFTLVELVIVIAVIMLLSAHPHTKPLQRP